MCFTATASYAAGTALLVTGVLSLRQAKTTPQRVLAAIPLIFSVQQFSEGLLWLSLSNPGYAGWRNISMYTFLLFAQVIWPAFVPLTILLFEKDRRRKYILRILSATGIATSLYLFYCLLFYSVSAYVEQHHIKYDLDFPVAFRWITGLLYIIAAVLSPLVSGSRHLRLLGWILLASYLVTRILYFDYLVSVWCYFAAVLSVVVLLIIRLQNKTAGPHRKAGN